MAEKMTPLQLLSRKLTTAESSALAMLAAELDGAPFGDPAPSQQHELVKSLMNSALGTLDGALGAQLQRANLPSTDPARHLFTWLLTGGQDTSAFTQEQLVTLYQWFVETQNHPTAVNAVMTAAKSGIYPTKMEDFRMSTDPQPPAQAPTSDPTTAPTTTQAPIKPENPGAVIAGLTSHSEAPLSASAKLYDANGIDWLVTVRAGADGSQFVAFLDVLNSAGAYALEHGFSLLNPHARQAQVAAPPARASLPTSGPAPAPVNQAPPAYGNGGGFGGNGGEQVFDATELVATVNNGKAYWKVKGGPWTQFGITAWPEVLESAGLTNLNPMETYSLTGWTAYYTVDGQNRKKVTRLVQNALN